MAHGDLIDSGARSADARWAAWKLLDNAAAVTDGEWVDVRGFRRIGVHVAGFGTATVQLRGSNAPTKPAAAELGVQIGPDLSADSLVDISVPVRWLKARVAAYTSGTLVAHAHAVE